MTFFKYRILKQHGQLVSKVTCTLLLSCLEHTHTRVRTATIEATA